MVPLQLLRSALHSTLDDCVLALRFHDVIALAISWYVRYRLSSAEVREWLAERSILVDQSTLYGWV